MFATILALLSSSAITALLTWLISRQKSKAEIEKIQADTDTITLSNFEKVIGIYKKASEDLIAEVSGLRKEVQQLRIENSTLKFEVTKLEQRLGTFQHATS